jgi:hypothetical protein
MLYKWSNEMIAVLLLGILIFHSSSFFSGIENFKTGWNNKFVYFKNYYGLHLAVTSTRF